MYTVQYLLVNTVRGTLSADVIGGEGLKKGGRKREYETKRKREKIQENFIDKGKICTIRERMIAKMVYDKKRGRVI
jgi:hypothetical protein